MPTSEIMNSAEHSMQSAVEHFKQELVKVRTGRASSTIIEGVKVDYYGTPTPISQVAAINIPDARTIMVQPWEKPMLQEVEKAILQADLGLNPNNDGNVIRIPVPVLTEERRKDYVKLCKKMAEDSRVSIRNARKHGMDALKKAEKDEHLPEDDRKYGEEQVQELTDKYVKQIDVLLEGKEKEIMEI